MGQDPDVRTMPNGDMVTKISVATSESWVDKNTNERKTQTEWHAIVFYRRQAEVAGEYLRKGSKVYVEGRLKTRNGKIKTAKIATPQKSRRCFTNVRQPI